MDECLSVRFLLENGFDSIFGKLELEENSEDADQNERSRTAQNCEGRVTRNELAKKSYKQR